MWPIEQLYIELGFTHNKKFKKYFMRCKYKFKKNFQGKLSQFSRVSIDSIPQVNAKNQYLLSYEISCPLQVTIKSHVLWNSMYISIVHNCMIKSYDFFMLLNILKWISNLKWVKTFVHLCHIDFEPIMQVSSPSDFYVIHTT